MRAIQDQKSLCDSQDYPAFTHSTMASVLIFPSGNSFSHLQECRMIGENLQKNGHDVHFGISAHYARWAHARHMTATVIPELWERGPTDHPNISWFIDHNHVRQCIQKEVELIRQFSPDYIIANFKYTTGVSARATGTPLISVNILATLPKTRANYGYLRQDQSPESIRQRKNLHFFNEFCCNALNRVAGEYSLPPLDRMEDFLDGDLVLVPDSLWFHQFKQLPDNYLAVNLLAQRREIPPDQTANLWNAMEPVMTPNSISSSSLALTAAENAILKNKRIFLALGSACRSAPALVHLVSSLYGGPWELVVSLSGTNDELEQLLRTSFPAITIGSFYSFAEQAKAGMDLFVCQGGLGSIFNAIDFGIPLFIIPQQPEQDHNGMLVETHNLGRRLWKSQAYEGKESFYIEKLLNTPKVDIARQVKELLTDTGLSASLQKAKAIRHLERSTYPAADVILRSFLDRKERKNEVDAEAFV